LSRVFTKVVGELAAAAYETSVDPESNMTGRDFGPIRRPADSVARSLTRGHRETTYAVERAVRNGGKAARGLIC
jgi:hypothetical protein